MENLLGLMVGIGLSAACGFRVFVPLLGISIAAGSGHLELASGFDWLGTEAAQTALIIATILEVATYYVPWLDNLMDSLATPAAVVAGSIITASMTGEMSPFLKWGLAIIAGGGTAGVVQTGTVAMRAVSSATTGGVGNPVVSTGELAGSVTVTALTIFVPVVAGIIVLILLYNSVRMIVESYQKKIKKSGVKDESELSGQNYGIDLAEKIDRTDTADGTDPKSIVNKSQIALVLIMVSFVNPAYAASQPNVYGQALPNVSEANKEEVKGQGILLIGDSLACGIGREMKRMYPGVTVACKPSSGLVRRDFYNWQSEASELLSEIRDDSHFKQVYVVMGINDSRQYRNDAFYRGRMKEFLELFRVHGAEICWISPPPCIDKTPPAEGETGLAQAARDISLIISSECYNLGVDYMDLWKFLADSDGSPRLNLRSRDKLHFLPATSKHIARRLWMHYQMSQSEI